MSIMIDKLEKSGLFTEDELDTLQRYKADLDDGKVYGVGINEYFADKTEENWNKAWVLVGAMYAEAQNGMDRWKAILIAQMLVQNRGNMILSTEAMKAAHPMGSDLREIGWIP